MEQTPISTHWQQYVLKLRQLAEEQGVTQQMLAERTGLQQSNISRIFRLVYVPTIKTLDNLANALGVEIVFRRPFEKIYDDRWEEINDLFQKHFKINLPPECDNLKEVITLVNRLHFKNPQWYMSFLASLMDIWQAYDNKMPVEDIDFE